MSFDIASRRGQFLNNIRSVFNYQGFTEVTTPRVDPEIIPEAHIDPFEVPGLGYLQASPEMHMKRLLCADAGPIFEIAQCFRQGERGRLHRPEFTMIEWYRPGDDMHEAMLFLDSLRLSLTHSSVARRVSYREAFGRVLDIDPHTEPLETLQRLASEQLDDRDELLNLILARHIEQTLGNDKPELLYHYPASQAALATTTVDEQGVEVAERFELYDRGIELANGYNELTDPVEMRRRLEEANAQRIADGRPALPLPEKLLAAMEYPGLPKCAGVALGLDRLLMLEWGADSIDEVCG